MASWTIKANRSTGSSPDFVNIAVPVIAKAQQVSKDSMSKTKWEKHVPQK